MFGLVYLERMWIKWSGANSGDEGGKYSESHGCSADPGPRQLLSTILVCLSKIAGPMNKLLQKDQDGNEGKSSRRHSRNSKRDSPQIRSCHRKAGETAEVESDASLRNGEQYYL